jgi:SAM-dependent methyltransferase
MFDEEADRQRRLWDMWARSYDEDQAENLPGDAVEFLTSRSSGGRFLELGVGTGRVALEVAKKGIGVDGVEISPEMASRLEKRRGTLDVNVILGDMANPKISCQYSCVYAVFSSFFHLTTQDSQLSCMKNAANALASGGLFVLECYVPQPALLRPSRNLVLSAIDEDGVHFSAVIANAFDQRMSCMEIILGAQGNVIHPFEQRYCWPSELDMMAQAAGLHLVQRYGGFDESAFGPASGRHVSVYAR